MELNKNMYTQINTYKIKLSMKTPRISTFRLASVFIFEK